MWYKIFHYHQNGLAEFKRDTDPIKVSLADNNTKLTFTDNWDGLRLTRRLTMVQYAISEYNQGKPASQRLIASNFVTANGSDLVYLVPITNTNYGTNQQADAYTSITFHSDNASYLSQDIGVPVKTDTQGTSTINGVKVGDLVKIQEKDTPSTLTTTTVTSDGSFSWVYELSKEYQVRIYRTGVDSPLFEISASATIGNPAFLPVSGATYIQPTGRTITDYVTVMESATYIIRNWVAEEDVYTNTKDPELDFWFEMNDVAPFGITANHLLGDVSNGDVILEQPFVPKVVTHEETEYKYIENNGGTKLKVDNNAEGISIQLTPDTNVSNIPVASEIKVGSHIRFKNPNTNTVYAEAIVTGVLINAGSDIYLDVSPALDPLSSNRNYRGKEIEVSVSHLEYVEKPVYLVSNQYKYRRTDGTLARVDKHIAFLPRETITVDVDGGYTEADRTNATEIKAGTTSWCKWNGFI